MYLVVVFGVTWVEREVMEPLQEEGREGRGVGSRGEA